MNRISVLTAMGLFSCAVGVNAVEVTQWYGTAHLAVESIGSSAEWTIDGNPSKGNRFGVKGGIDTSLYDFRAIYQLEVGVDANRFSGDATDPFLYQRDSWVGVSSRSLGQVRVGTIGTRYQETGSTVDMLWGTPGEGRGVLGIMSPLHAETTGDTGSEGRLMHSFRYDVPTFYSGFSASILYHLRSNESNNYGLSLQYHHDWADIYFEQISIARDATAHAVSASKLAASIKLGEAFIGMQGEFDSGALSQYDGTAHSAFVNAGYRIQNSILTGSFGWKSDSGNVSDGGKDDGRMGFVFALVQRLSKSTMGYAEWGMAIPKVDPDVRFAAFGLKHDF